MSTVEAFAYGGPTQSGTSPSFETAGGYIVLPVTIDPNELAANAIQSIMAAIPGWFPTEGHLEVLLIEAVAQMVAEAAQVAAQVPLAIFRYFGGLVGVLPEQGATATVNTTWAMVDTKGYTIPAGTYVTYQASGNQTLLFQTMFPVVVLPGASSTPAGSVVLQAQSVGAAYNAASSPFALYDSLAYVSSITATGPSAGGVDPETDTAYLQRLASELALLAPRPILPPDFAALARQVPGVTRAVAVDGFNPTNGTTGNERTVAIAAVDLNGNALTSTVTAAVVTYLQALREANFIVNVFAPSYTPVAITATLTCTPSSSPNTVQAAVVTALQSFLSPANWGGGTQTPPAWQNDTLVRYLDVVGVIASVPGVDLAKPSAITLGGGPTPTLTTLDVSLLPGGALVGLPTVGAINVSVSAP